MNNNKTYIAIILDNSGSMSYMKKQAINGYNENVQAILEEINDPNRGEIYSSLIIFNGKVNEIFFNKNVTTLYEINEDQYNPTGNTAYYDALGYTIDKLRKETDPNDEYNSYLIISISDGEENASKNWTKSTLFKIITDLEKTNRWTFTFIGANQDIQNTKETLNLRDGNTIEFTADKDGISTVLTNNAHKIKKYLKEKNKSPKNFSTSNFYDY